jgi:hypothetical protein
MPRRKEETPCDLTAVVVSGSRIHIVPFEDSPRWEAEGFTTFGCAVTREGVAKLRIMAERK